MEAFQALLGDDFCFLLSPHIVARTPRKRPVMTSEHADKMEIMVVFQCPHYDEDGSAVGDLSTGLNILNRQLYQLDHAPLCRRCDAYQCRRCIWLNHKITLEVNTPSHEQCVIAHIERNASKKLLDNIRRHGEFLPDKETIKKIDYLDPFDVRKEL